MKLLTRYIYSNIISSIAIFILASAAFYILLHHILIRQVDNDLEIEQHEIELYVDEYHALPESMPVRDQQIQFFSAKAHDTTERIFSTAGAAAANNIGSGDIRQLVFYIRTGSSWHKAIVSKSLGAANKMTRSIVLISLGTILCMLVVSFVINRLILQNLWLPFYRSLSAMKAYRLGQGRPRFDPTSIDEFHALNQTLEQSVHNTEMEYQRLKEFTENASHELQTPLAIIRSKMDVLIQDENLSPEQGNTIQGAYDALDRLARLNQSMLLLNKIENNQFTERTSLDLGVMVSQKLDSFKEIWKEKRIRLATSLADCNISMNGMLAEIMLNNLLSNATRHTPAGGTIGISLSAEALTISNAAAHGPLDKHQLFTRFYKGGQPTDSQGLGLSIVRQIILVSGFSIGYSFEEGEHRFAISFT